VDVNTVRTLVVLQQAHPESAIISPLHLDGTGNHLDLKFANHIGKAATVQNILSDAVLKKDFTDLYNVDFINAAIWLLSRECIRRVGLFNPGFDHYREDNEYIERVHYHGLHVSLAPNCKGYHDRTNDPRPESFTLKRYIVMVNATINYRISRRKPGVWFNLASAVSYILLSNLPDEISFLHSMGLKIYLFSKMISTLPTLISYRKRAYRETRCFFEDAELDRQRYTNS
jgi:GT2 family glycosyltransferase